VIPLKDENPTRRAAVVTLLLIAVNVVVYFWLQPNPQDPARSTQFVYSHAAIPCEVTTNEPLSDVELRTGTCNEQPEGTPMFPAKNVWLAVLVSMFLHGSLLHLGGNMLFLWIFGNNIEDHLGGLGYLAFYLVGGLVATAAHVLVDPTSTVPVVGASGAIAAVMGAYLAWFPNVRIRTLIFFFFIIVRDISAKWLLIIWFALQFVDATNPSSSVAWAAHVGGFVFGFLAGLVMRASRVGTAPAMRGPY
jgi:membrane associated rhomboid family serine protease